MKIRRIKYTALILLVAMLLPTVSCMRDLPETETESATESASETKTETETETETESETETEETSAETESETVISVKKLYINEVCSDNKTSLKDAKNNHYDWIEIYNGEDENVNLEGYSLSDSASKMRKFVFPSVEIEAHGYIIVFACGEEKVRDGDIMYAAFKVSAGGETLYLASPERVVVDTVTVPALDTDTTYGRVADGGAELSKMFPSPNSSNSASELIPEPVETPSFLQKSGFYESEFELEINVPEGCTVYYTLNGAVPDKDSTEYTGAITIKDASANDNVYSAISGTSPYGYLPEYKVDKGTVVRAVAVNEDGRCSASVTATYFLGYETRKGYQNIPVVSLTTDPENLFDETTGIYVLGDVYTQWKESLKGDLSGVPLWQYPGNYSKRGSEWERIAHIEYFDQEHNSVFSSAVGIRIHGGASRSSLQKSFNVYFRDSIGGSDKVDIPLFDSVTEVSSFMLRSGGNDYDSTKFRDAVIQSLVSDRDFATQEAHPCILFINGEYWGMYNIQEKYSADYFEEHYGVDADNVVLIKNGGLKEGTRNDQKSYLELITLCSGNKMLDSAKYENVCSKMDIQSFIDYMCAEIIICNCDWPGNNYAVWKVSEVDESNPYADGKWRWVMFDTEFSTGLTYSTSVDYDSISYAMNNSLFTALMKNEEFRKQFTLTLSDLMNENFAYDRVQSVVKYYTTNYRSAMYNFYLRFVNDSPSTSRFSSSWRNFTNFFARRRERMNNIYMSYYNVGESVKVTLLLDDTASGYVVLNTIEPQSLKDSGQWDGYYFSGYPITLTAVANDGYSFVGWEISEGGRLEDGFDAHDSTVSVAFDSDITVRAIFAAK